MKRAVLEEVAAAQMAKRPVVIVTPLGAGNGAGNEGARVWSPGAAWLGTDLREAAERALATDDAFTVETSAGPVFVKPVNPPLRLVIVGAVHVAEPLSVIASILGYEVTIIDPRASFARAERWPSGVAVKTDWPDEVLAAIGVDHRTAVVTLTHDTKIDDPALEAALRGPTFYIGALGSKKNHALRLARLAERGYGEVDLGRIHGPIGLPIGARSPGEIAVAIVGQMTEVLRRGSPSISARAGRSLG